MEIPKLKLGQGYLGAEFAGCINSGQRAVMFRSKVWKSYLVGTESDLYDVRNTRAGVNALAEGKRSIQVGSGRKVYQFKSRQAAVTKFRQINQRVLDYNAAARERASKAAEAAKNGDFGTAWQLSD